MENPLFPGMPSVGKYLVSGAYALFLSLYIYAAAAYGLTRANQIGPFAGTLGVIFFIWLAGYLLQGRLPRIGVWPCLLVASILAFGWGVTGLGYLKDVFDDGDTPAWLGQRFYDFLSDWSTFDTEASIDAMIRTTALLGGMLMAIDFWSEPARARGIALMIIFSSFGMVLFFLLQRIVGPPFILLSEDGRSPLSFATYRYHGNAAAYLNLFWPITAGVAISAAVRQNFAWPLWFLPLAATLLATFLNVSKAGNVLAPVGIVILLLMLIPYLAREIKHPKRRIRRSRILVALIPILIIAVSIPFALPWNRWGYFAQTFNEPSKGRATAYAEFLKMIPIAGSTGFGPGTFSKYSLVYTHQNPLLADVWYYAAHEDYLQTVIEWGYIGTCLWGLLLVPPFAYLFRFARRAAGRSSSDFEGYRIGIIDHVKAYFEKLPGPREPCLAAGAFTAITLTAIHSAFDFPMQIASLQFYFLTLIALGWSYRVADRTPANPRQEAV